jgi:hypothetical protein
MKKLLLITFAFLMEAQLIQAQTATNFNCNDCAATNHDLYAELDAGKVVVISWVMPCSSCVGPSLAAYNEVLSYANPNIVFYLADDYANTSCTSLTNWANTNGMTSCNAKFSNSAVKMSDYGSAGMPKVVVLGGASHTIYYNQNNPNITQTDIHNAIEAAITANVTGIKENYINNFQLSLFPNPVKDKKTVLTYTLNSNEEVSIDIYNSIGELVKSVIKGEHTPGKYEQSIDLAPISAGTYFIKVNMGHKSDVLKFVISE